MDFMKRYDARSAAEAVTEYQILDQETGDPISNGEKPCIVLLRGSAARSVQSAIREEEIAKMQAAKKGAKPDPQALEDLHRSTIKSAMRLIVGFKNMQTRGADGKLRDLTIEDAEAFLDLTFISLPHLLRKAGDDEWTKPSFAQQIIEAGAQGDRFFKAASTA